MEESICDQMEDFKDEIRKLISTLSNELKKANTALKDIQQTNYNIENSVSFLSGQNEEFRQRITELETQAKYDKNYITILEDKIEEMQVANRKAFFEIKNVPKTNNESKEDLIEMVANLSKNIECNISKLDIKDIFRVRPKKSSDITNMPIVVETNSTLLKNNILKSAKAFNYKHKSKLCAKHLGCKSFDDTPIYLSEHLTPKGARLYFLARDLKKSKNFKFCWTAYGKVYIRESEQSPIIMIRNELQIQQLLHSQQQGPSTI